MRSPRCRRFAWGIQSKQNANSGLFSCLSESPPPLMPEIGIDGGSLDTKAKRLLVTGIATVVAVASLASAAGGAVEAAVPAPVRQDVPPLVSQPLATTVPASPLGQFASTLPSASAPLPPSAIRPVATPIREVVSERAADRDVWQNTDGSKSVRLFTSPRYYEPLGSSSFVPIDPSVEVDPTAPGWLRSTANSWIARFGPASAASSVELKTGGGVIAFQPIAVSKVDANTTTAASNEVAYPQLWPGVDATYDVNTQGVKETLTLNSPGARSSFDFNVSGATAQMTKYGGIDLVVGGVRVATVPAPTVSDASGYVDPAVAGVHLETPADSSGQVGGRVRIALDSAWLASLPIAAFPVVIDPSINPGVPGSYSLNNSDQQDTTSLKVGRSSGKIWRALLNFNYGPWAGYQVLNATLEVPADLPGSVTPPQATPLTAYQVTATSPTFAQLGQGTVAGSGTDNGGAALDVTNTYRSWIGGSCGTVCNRLGLVGKESGTATTLKIYTKNSNFQPPQSPYLVLDVVQPPPATTVTTPSAGSVISSLTPTLLAAPVSEANCSFADLQLYYDFRVSTNADGTGAIADSGWLPETFDGNGQQLTPQWPIPAGQLLDGVTYYSSVLTNCASNGSVVPLPAGGFSEFSLKLRLGAGGPSPTDTVGSLPGQASEASGGSPSPQTPTASVTVNMVTGNLALALNTHAVSTVAGSLGFGITYNSLTQSNAGLLGQYFADVTGTHDFTNPSNPIVGQRTDPSVAFTWTNTAPIGGLPNGAPFMARWTGYVTPPSAGTWQFGTISSHGMRVYLDGGTTPVVDNWTSHTAPSSPTYGAALSLSAGQHQLRIEMWSNVNPAVAQLFMKNVTANPPVEYLVPANWLTRTPQFLPAGFQFSANASAASYIGLRDQGSSVAVTQADGSTIEFTQPTSGGTQTVYVPPPGHQESLSKNSNGTFQLATQDNLLYTFNLDGTLASVTTIVDDLHPAAAQLAYAGNPPLLQSVTDPVSNRQITFAYLGDPTCPSNAFAPAGMLCAINFWDGTQTVFGYDSTVSGRLIRVTNPGVTITDFAYDSNGRLWRIRDPLAYDMVAAGEDGRTDLNDVNTTITYDSAGRVQTVESPGTTGRGSAPVPLVQLRRSEPQRGMSEPYLHDHSFGRGVRSLLRLCDPR